MYENKDSVTCDDTTARIEDIEQKIRMLDDHFNRKNFSLVAGENEIYFENFLAKDVLKAVRFTLQGVINDLHKTYHKDGCKLELEEGEE